MTLDGRTYALTIHRVRQTTTEQRFFLPLPAGIIVSRLQIEASIEKTNDKSPNTCDIKIRNMAPATRAEVQRDGVIIVLDAGYQGVNRRVFAGDLTHSYSYKDGTDWVTELQVGDGARAFAFARANRRFKPGTPMIDVLREAARSMGLALPKDIEASSELREQFAGGYALNGRARDELTRLLAPFGYSWSIQGGSLQILRDDETREDQARVISEGTGMIGSPIFGKPEKKGHPPKRSVKALLYPELIPGGKVDIQSRALNGFHRIERVKHSLDFEGAEWTTEVEVKQA